MLGLQKGISMNFMQALGYRPADKLLLMLGLFVVLSLAFITFLPEPALVEAGSSSQMPPACSWAGTWNTNYGVMSLTQSGSMVEGNYELPDPNAATGGIIPGVIQATVENGALNGRWSLPEELTSAGRFVFSMEEDCNSFIGTWGYGDRSSGGQGPFSQHAGYWRGIRGDAGGNGVCTTKVGLAPEWGSGDNQATFIIDNTSCTGDSLTITIKPYQHFDVYHGHLIFEQEGQQFGSASFVWSEGNSVEDLGYIKLIPGITLRTTVNNYGVFDFTEPFTVWFGSGGVIGFAKVADFK